MFHVSTIALNPQPHNFLFPLPVSTSRNLPLSQTLHFPRNWNLRSLSPSLHLTYDDSDDHVIGDCVVFEDGVFDEPVFHNHHLNSDNLAVDKPKPKPGRSWRKKVEETLGENLVPDKWREVQAEINITKREMRKIAREVEFNSKVEKKRRGLIPLRDMNLDDYKAYKEAKLAQMKLLDYASCSPVGQNVPEAEPEFNRGGEEVAEAEPELNAGERVEPKNPRWAVYGRGLEDVTEFFNSDNYDPTAKTLGGRRKLFNKEEKVLLNKRIPDLAAATSDKWLPLHTLAACGEFYLLDSLLKHNVDINVLKNEDSGPLKESTSLIKHQLVKLTEQSLFLKKRTNQTKPRPIVVRLDDGDVAPISVKRPEPMDDIVLNYKQVGMRTLLKVFSLVGSCWSILPSSSVSSNGYVVLSLLKGKKIKAKSKKDNWPGAYCDTKQSCCYPKIGKPVAILRLGNLLSIIFWC